MSYSSILYRGSRFILQESAELISSRKSPIRFGYRFYVGKVSLRPKVLIQPEVKPN